MNLLMDLLTGGGEGFNPHEICLLFDPSLMAWTIVGDGMTAIAYAVIPLLIVIEMRRGRLSMPRWVFALFGSFIALCGISHVLMIYTLFWPAYWLEAGEKVLGGSVSMLTAVMLPFAKPRNGLSVQWWRRARAVTHDRNNLRQKYIGMCRRYGEPIPEWPADDDLPEPPT